MKDAKQDVDKMFPKEHCICAAIKFLNGEIVKGRRHDNCYREAISLGVPDTHNATQGFITSTGRFVDRKEGMIIQRATGLPSKYGKDGAYLGEDLFSEDLY